MRTSRLVLSGVIGLVSAYGLYHRTDAYRHGNRLF